jgi:GcrA cell cycle regulator
MTQSSLAPSNPTPPPPAAIWPDARIEALTQAWRDGLSARQIAAQLGAGLTRSAVIGKLHRLGVCGGRKPSAPRAAVSLSPPLKVAKPDPAALAPRWPDAILEAPPISPASGAPPCGPGPKYLRDMAPRECRFGLGDPGPGNGAFQLFCAAPTTGHAYCAHHRAIALLPPQSLAEQKVIDAADQALFAAVDGARRAVRRCRSGDTP